MLAIPDTSLVREAVAIVTRVLPPPVLGHSLRAYHLASAYARKHAKDHDEEGLCLAALFHDVGLSPSVRGTHGERVSFQLSSSRALRDFMREKHAPEERILPLIDAIDFHMQLAPRWAKGNVAGLLQIGAWSDATRLGRWRVGDEATEIAAHHPRDGFDLQFAKSLLGSLVSVRACWGLFFPKPSDVIDDLE